MNKKSFVMHSDNYESVKNLSQYQKGCLLDAIYQYVAGETIPVLRPETEMAFSFIKRQLNRDDEKWEKIRKVRQQAGRLGGLKKAENEGLLPSKASKTKQSLANQAVSVSVSDSVSVNSYNNEEILLKPVKSLLDEEILFHLRGKTVGKSEGIDSDIYFEALERGLVS